MIRTDIFKADKKRFAMLLLERHGQSWLFGGFFLFLTAMILGFTVDYRIFILALLLVCLIAPALLLILYYNYGMRGENFLNVLDHRIEIGSDMLSLFLKIKGGENEEADEENEPQEEWRRYDYPFSCFGNYSVGKDYVVFPLLAPKAGFLYLPLDAFDNHISFSEAVKRISKKECNENNQG
ncbi:MAG: hypothetical protein HDS95_05415 [Bacteroidales bacterium]|nr:hypothetical protein [Bacteroidales bacterium]